jgi:hypothetical protein
MPDRISQLPSLGQKHAQEKLNYVWLTSLVLQALTSW